MPDGWEDGPGVLDADGRKVEPCVPDEDGRKVGPAEPDAVLDEGPDKGVGPGGDDGRWVREDKPAAGEGGGEDVVDPADDDEEGDGDDPEYGGLGVWKTASD